MLQSLNFLTVVQSCLSQSSYTWSSFKPSIMCTPTHLYGWSTLPCCCCINLNTLLLQLKGNITSNQSVLAYYSLACYMLLLFRILNYKFGNEIQPTPKFMIDTKLHKETLLHLKTTCYTALHYNNNLTTSLNLHHPFLCQNM